MDGDTWHSYRFVTEPGTEPPFILEPVNPSHWPTLFEALGATIRQADTGRAIHLVRRAGEKVTAQFGDIQRQMRDALRRLGARTLDLAAMLDVTNPIRVVIDETTPLAKLSESLEGAGADATIVLHAESGALEAAISAVFVAVSLCGCGSFARSTRWTLSALRRCGRCRAALRSRPIRRN